MRQIKELMIRGKNRFRKMFLRAVCLYVMLFSLSVITGIAIPETADAAIQVTVSGSGGTAGQSLPDEGGTFDLDLPLNPNAVNHIKVTAKDDAGNEATKELDVTQVSLNQIVVSKITTERLSVEEVEKLVVDGVIDLEDPENYNVSTFNIVLTIDKKPVPVSIPIAIPINEPDPTGYEKIRMPQGDDSGSPTPQPVEILVFEQHVSPSVPGDPVPPPIPGVIIIEGNIKSLKEFFNVRLLLMNTSGIFTLSNVMAEIALPAGKLSNVLPSDGINSFGDIIPGENGAPGQKEQEFIIRGDSIGIHNIKVSFGGTVTGPGITVPIAFNGSAVTEVEVKGPPTFLVEVTHPDEVIKDVPYELLVDITNTGTLTAMYASLELGVGADARIETCKLNTGNNPVCEFTTGPEVRPFGHIEPGETVRETFTIMPSTTGEISSCVAASDQNITLNVYMGTQGCMVGHYPPKSEVADGIPTVTVIPAPNTSSIHESSAVTAFFSEKMNVNTITTGTNGTFNVFDSAGNIVPGQLRFEYLYKDTEREKTIIIWQVNDGVTNRFASKAKYSVVLTQEITDMQGNSLANRWESSFTTTDSGINDTTPPNISMSVAPPVNPNAVLPGEIIKINTYAADAGSGISRVELHMKELGVDGALFTLIGQKTVFKGDKPPFIFTIDSATLNAGSTYQARAIAYDGMGNAQDSTLAFVMLASSAPPTVVLPDGLPAQVLQGISITLIPEVSAGVRRVEYFLDGSTTAYKTVTLSPFQGSLGTLELSLESHNITVKATDGLGQQGEALYNFVITKNINKPAVGFAGVADGAVYTIGESILINGTADDEVGIRSISYYLDSTSGDPIYSGFASILLNTNGLATGNHTVYVRAENSLGTISDINDPAAAFEFSIVEPPPGIPPAAPSITTVGYPVDGMVAITGNSVANARITVTNTDMGISVTVNANNSGSYTASIPGQAGHNLVVVAYDLNASPDPSTAANTIVQAEPVLSSITASPSAITFTTAGASNNITVTGHYLDGSTVNLTGQATFTSSAPSIATVSSSGTVVGVSYGVAQINVSVKGVSTTVQVNSNIITLTGISISPESITLVAVSQTASIGITGHYSDGSSHAITTGVSFITGDPSIATVNSEGVVTAKTTGTTQIHVSYPGVASVTALVTVNTAQDQVPVASIINPSSGTIVQRDETVNIVVHAQDDIGGVTRIHLNASGAINYTETIQVSPASTSVTTTFHLDIDVSATIGRKINVSVTAEDTSGGISEPAIIELTVGDTTAPQVTISQPAQQTPYNFGDTVTVVVDAHDIGGVDGIYFEAEGAIAASNNRLFPSLTSAQAIFTLLIPYNISETDIKLTAYAVDSQGNEGDAIPVNILITGADITPPETEVTTVTDPGSTSVSAISYEVTSGMEDLDYVVLYYRRNGIGTFNRYSGPLGDEEGEYFPENGSEGTIQFDSTRMGGDGNYEFYTVGVDTDDNHEAVPVDENNHIIADKTQDFNSGTIWRNFTESTVITADDHSYDNQNIRVSGSNVVLTINGTHSFHNVELLNSAMLTHSKTTATIAFILNISAWTVTIDNNSSINVTGRGYLGGNKTGDGEWADTVGFARGSGRANGGSYGGKGGHWGNVGEQPNPVYGDITNPLDLGSGGGAWDGAGGDGGGLIVIQAINMITDGIISADGGLSSGSASGEGSGGGVNLNLRTLSGSGNIHSNGGGTGGSNHTGGGGGRIAIRYHDLSTYRINLLASNGGDGYYGDGAYGTITLLSEESDLVINGQPGISTFTEISLPADYTFHTVILQNNARVITHNAIAITGTLRLTGNSLLTHSTGNTSGLQINAARVEVESGSAIDVTDRGYAGGNNSGYGEYAVTLGGLRGSGRANGGSYGGLGGHYNGSSERPNLVYGNPKEPDKLGSGGGAWDGAGGYGGGYIHITASDAVVVDGAILANGGLSSGSASGEGSGGSVWITTSMLSGNGTISANGGTTNGSNHTSGGGGRVAIYLDYLDSEADLDNLHNVTAFGGRGYYDSEASTAGTVFIQYRNETEGDLVIDGNYVGNTAPTPIRLPLIGPGKTTAVDEHSLTGDGLVVWPVNGLTGLRVNPDVTQDETFIIISNTVDTLVVQTPNENGVSFDSVAGQELIYTGEYTFDNVFFRRGGNLETGDHLVVNDTMKITEYGMLTHPETNTAYAARLDLKVRKLEIDNTGCIDVTGRGYLGGNKTGDGEWADTVNFARGSGRANGGSYGGLGGHYNVGEQPNTVYGDVTDPDDLGSGGGAWDGAGGDGGGRIFILATDITLDGVIRANGGISSGSASGEGSGGTINIDTGTLHGTGMITANGGSTGGSNHTGGGGGRIAIRYSDDMSLPESNIKSLGGDGYYGDAGHGSVYIKSLSQEYGDLIIDGNNMIQPDNTSIIKGGLIFDNIIIRNRAKILADNAITVNDTLRLTGNSILTHSTGNESGLQINAARVEVDESSLIDVTGKGYAGGNNSGDGENAVTLGGLRGSGRANGGSYGGLGGHYSVNERPNPVYGNPKVPDKLGSGGGAWDGAGGYGGGYIRIIASDAIVVDGSIRANGGLSSGSASGEGSGGSVWITTSRLAGNGTISADGGTTNGSNHTSGGGGRVAIYLDHLDSVSDLNDLRNVTAFSGRGYYDNEASAAGTVFIKYSNEVEGSLIIDNNIVGNTASGGTRLPLIGPGKATVVNENSLTGDSLVTWPVNGLAGLRINPDVTQGETFVIVSNTTNAIIVQTPNENNIEFIDIAGQNFTYAGVYTFDNVFFRRGGHLETGDRLYVNDTMEIKENGMLTHPETNTTYAARLDLTVDNLVIDSTGRIDVTGRGYLGGNKTGDGEWADTVGFARGSGRANGGSYGGLGGHFSSVGEQPNPVYGDITNPLDLGSGGGAYNGAGGDGGGRVFIRATDITLNGVIGVNGGLSSGNASGEGAGGTVNIRTVNISGTGMITANGGTTGGSNHVGGGGGRITIRYKSDITLPEANIICLGGDGYYGDGQNGTVRIIKE
jgi:large repetitive protein